MLNIWSTAPFWRTYLETLGIQRQNVVFSDETTEELWMEGGKYGSVDPCYPSKVGQAHIHNLLFHHHSDEKPLHYIFNPVITHIPSFVKNAQDYTSCPIVQGSPNVLRAAFTKEVDFFGQRGITYLDPACSLIEPHLLKRQMYAVLRRAARHHRGRERLRLRGGLRGPAHASTSRWRPRAGPCSTRSSARTGWPSC